MVWAGGWSKQHCGPSRSGAAGKCSPAPRATTLARPTSSPRDFTILTFGEQFRRYGFLGTFWLWLRTSRLGGDGGNFLWARPGQLESDSPALQWWVGALANALVLLLVGWRGHWLSGFDPATLLGVVLIVVVLLGLREGAMRLVTWLHGLPVHHRAWE